MLPKFLESAAALDIFTRAAAPTRAVLDSATENGITDAARAFAGSDTAMRAAATVQAWAETDRADLDEGETLADRLVAMLVGVADDSQDGELDEDEQVVFEAAAESAWDYLTRCGAADDDVDAIFNGEADAAGAAADRVIEKVIDSLPDGEAAADAVDSFAFGAADQGAVFDAVYRKAVAIRGGKKVRIKKRIAGVVRLSGKQRLSIRKAQLKSHSAGAMTRRARSLRVRKSLNITAASR